ncbi:hypothetical protein ACQP3C_25340, partial [Escherichia coli]
PICTKVYFSLKPLAVCIKFLPPHDDLGGRSPGKRFWRPELLGVLHYEVSRKSMGQTQTMLHKGNTGSLKIITD